MALETDFQRFMEAVIREATAGLAISAEILQQTGAAMMDNAVVPGPDRLHWHLLLDAALARAEAQACGLWHP